MLAAFVEALVGASGNLSLADMLGSFAEVVGEASRVVVVDGDVVLQWMAGAEVDVAALAVDASSALCSPMASEAVTTFSAPRLVLTRSVAE